jgi:hypothetical protein
MSDVRLYLDRRPDIGTINVSRIFRIDLRVLGSLGKEFPHVMSLRRVQRRSTTAFS